LTTAFYIFIAILFFSFLIIIHELGHFIAAKRSNVQVNEFSIFMGPAIFQKQIGETMYSLRCIPVGGYCALEGEDGNCDSERSFSVTKLWEKLIILVAGSATNFLAGFLMILMIYGLVVGAIPSNKVESIVDGRPFAGERGLQSGDEFYSINGNRILVQNDITTFLDRRTDGKQSVVVIRNGEKVNLGELTFARDYDDGSGSLRYGFSVSYEEKNFGNVISYSWRNSLNFARLVWMSLGDLISRRVNVGEVSGPVGIVKIVVETGSSSESVSDGFLQIVYLFSFIAINLAVMNMLPIPALDGGRVVTVVLTAIIEKITKKKLNPKYEAVMNGVCLVLLLGLMAVITIKDIVGLFRG